MTDTFDNDTDEQEQREPLDPKIREELRAARADRKAKTEAETELAALKRDMAFDKAGIPETGAGALLRKAYDGDLSADAIKRSAEEYGILSTNAPTESDEMRAELESLRRAQSGVREQGEPEQEAVEEFYSKVRSAKGSTDVIDAINDAQKRGLPVRLATDQGRN